MSSAVGLAKDLRNWACEEHVGADKSERVIDEHIGGKSKKGITDGSWPFSNVSPCSVEEPTRRENAKSYVASIEESPRERNLAPYFS
jgi:hypothetical protein